MQNALNVVRSPRCLRAWLLWGLACLVVGVPGCGGGDPSAPTARVEGTVTFGDQPVATGEVVFMTKGTGFAATAPLVAGKFSMESPIKAGDYTVLVTPPPPPPPDPVKPVAPPKDPADIPAKYRSEVTSPLKATVKSGQNTVSFKLEP